MKLIKLPSGDWINPHSVTSISVLGKSKSILSSNENPPRVVVNHGEIITVIPCETMKQAQTRADQIASLVNSIPSIHSLTAKKEKI